MIRGCDIEEPRVVRQKANHSFVSIQDMRPVLRILPLAAALVLPSSLFAQSPTPVAAAAQTWAGSIYAGGSIATHSHGERQLRIGPNAGATIERSLSRTLTVQFGTWYVVKGWRDGDGSMTQRYAEFPVLVRLSRRPSKRAVHPVLLFGLAPAFEMTCSSRGRNGGSVGPGPGPAVGPMSCNENRTNGFDFGVVVGGGIELRQQRVTPTIEVRYTHGVFDIGNLFRWLSIYNRSLSLIGGLRIGL